MAVSHFPPALFNVKSLQVVLIPNKLKASWLSSAVFPRKLLQSLLSFDKQLPARFKSKHSAVAHRDVCYRVRN